MADEKKILFSGMQATGNLTLGNYLGALKNWVSLNEDYECYYCVVDEHSITVRQNPAELRQRARALLTLYIAAGLDPEKNVIFVQSHVKEHAELALLLGMSTPLGWLERVPTYKDKIRDLEGTNKDLHTYGFLGYPVLMAADIMLYKATCVPVGEDQSAHLELIREIVRRFNHIYGETLVEPEILLPTNAVCLRLPGTDGKAKMSKSLGNCIYLSDPADVVEKKVKSMYTDPTHIKVSDPGKLEGNTVFTYLDAFSRPEHFERYLPDYPNLDELKAHYTRGGLGDMKVKKFLSAIMQEELGPIRERRKEFEKDIPAVYEMLRKGCEVARETASATLDEVRRAMKINYFDDADLIAEQAKRFAGE